MENLATTVVNSLPTSDTTTSSGINESIYSNTLPNFGEKIYSQTDKSSPEINDSGSAGSSNLWLILTIIILAVLLILLVVCLWIRRQKRQAKSTKVASTYAIENGTTPLKPTQNQPTSILLNKK